MAVQEGVYLAFRVQEDLEHRVGGHGGAEREETAREDFGVDEDVGWGKEDGSGCEEGEAV